MVRAATLLPLLALAVFTQVLAGDPVTDRWNLNFPSDASPFWRLLCKARPTSNARVDPIVAPGTWAGHVHKVVGSAGFGTSKVGQSPVDFYWQLKNASCTSCNIKQLDMSSYWHPELYYKRPDGTLQVVQGEGLTVYYLSRRGGSPNWWIPFPKGFRMIAGNQNRRSYDPTNPSHNAVSYACYGGGGFSGTAKETNGFPGLTDRRVGCSALRIQIFFPTCWNGRDLDSQDHQSHMAYPIGDLSQGNCPATHPYRVPGLFFEGFYNTGNYPHGDGSTQWPFILSQSDTTGYGMHGDFVSGWDEDFLHKALHDPSCNCGNVDCCNTFKNYAQGGGISCPLDTPIPFFEDIGVATPIRRLPGCNNLTAVGPNAPACVAPSPALTDASTGVQKSFWAYGNQGILTPPWDEGSWTPVNIGRKVLDAVNVWSVNNVPNSNGSVAFQNILSKGWLVHWTGNGVYSLQQNWNDVSKNNWYWWKPELHSAGLYAIGSMRNGQYEYLTYNPDGKVTAERVTVGKAQLWSYSDRTKWNS